MQNREFHVDDIIDLGQASTETKGQAVFGIDPDAGKRDYLAGIVED
ncbi:MAG: benenodin family lasso peptide [Sphingomonadaceae bacterium]